MCGLPGSGKTTLAKALESRPRAVRFSADEWMDAPSIDIYDEEKRGKVEALQWKFGQELLALDLTVIIEWGTWGRSERDTLRLGARALGAAVELHYPSAPVDVLFDRIQRRGLEKPTIERDCIVLMVRDVPSTDTRGDGTLRQASACRPFLRLKLTHYRVVLCRASSICFAL